MTSIYDDAMAQESKHRERIEVALANVSGALTDAGGVVPDDPALYGEAVREIVAQMDAARLKAHEELSRADDYLRILGYEREGWKKVEAQRDAFQARLDAALEALGLLYTHARLHLGREDGGLFDDRDDILSAAVTGALSATPPPETTERRATERPWFVTRGRVAR